MTKICTKCNRPMAFDPYFNKYVCRQCGYTEQISKTVYIRAHTVSTKKSASLVKTKCIIVK